MHWEGIIRHYGRFFTSVPEEAVVTLLEGNTPLVPAPALARRIAPGTSLYLKYEGLNPTGSFKDRGMTAAISVAAKPRRRNCRDASPTMRARFSVAWALVTLIAASLQDA